MALSAALSSACKIGTFSSSLKRGTITETWGELAVWFMATFRDNMKSCRRLVIPNEVEESRSVTLKTSSRDPSTPLRFAQDDSC